MTTQSNHAASGRKPVPRGINLAGPALLSYGYRPFFLLAGLFAIGSMVMWIGALALGWQIGGSRAALNWHAHEMLFGYASAALAGFMLTAIPNWTGRLPVSGMPLLLLVLIWVAGRVVMAAPELVGMPVSLTIDGLFLPLLAAVAAREIIAGRNWKNLKILIGLIALSLANIWFEVIAATTGSTGDAARPAVAVYVMLIALMGGRIIPSFTRNWLVKQGRSRLPKPFNRFDVAAMLVLLVALMAWVIQPSGFVTSVSAIIAAGFCALRLWRWCGWQTFEEPLLIVLHLAYAFIPLGMLGIALASFGWMQAPSALHILVVGVIGNMTFAVMTRASLGHTGRPIVASLPMSIALLALLVSAIVRPLAELVPQYYSLILAISGASWLTAFAIFVAILGPMLLTARRRA